MSQQINMYGLTILTLFQSKGQAWNWENLFERLKTAILGLINTIFNWSSYAYLLNLNVIIKTYIGLIKYSLYI